ncbi:MAG TPA: 5-(carboxyamino)imidazole ribonucleotide synthase [Acidimicrobiia bacterium]
MVERNQPTLVAVLGGGQLGRMLALAGVPLGLRFRFLDPHPDASAGEVGDLVVGNLGDEQMLAAVADGAAVVTYEWEGVPADAARFLEQRVLVRPGTRSLTVAQDRLAEKEIFRRLGIATPQFAAVDRADDLDAAIGAVGGLPAVLKTRRGGYDGKGQRVLYTAGDAIGAWDHLGGVPAILEAHVMFDRELSVLAVRDADGGIACWPIAENHHSEGILRLTRAPAPNLDDDLQARAETIAAAVLADLGHVGVLAVELFDVGGELLANEIAPRVHNSGHWTIEGAVTSQFENHLRAILDRPLGPTTVRGVSVMVNCIGGIPDRTAVTAIPGAYLHDYGKVPRPGRKVGHITVIAPDNRSLEQNLDRVLALVGNALPTQPG